MLRLKPTVLALTAAEVKEHESRWRHRQRLSAEKITDEAQGQPSGTGKHHEPRIRISPPSPGRGSLNHPKTDDITAHRHRDPLATPPAQSLRGRGAVDAFEPSGEPAVGLGDPGPVDFSTPRRLRIRRPQRASPVLIGGERRVGLEVEEGRLEQPTEPSYSPSFPAARDTGQSASSAAPQGQSHPEILLSDPSADTELSLQSSTAIPRFPLPASRAQVAASTAAADAPKVPTPADISAQPTSADMHGGPATPSRSSSLQGQADNSPSSVSSSESRTRSLMATVRSLRARVTSASKPPSRMNETGTRGPPSPTRPGRPGRPAVTTAASSSSVPLQLDGASTFHVYNDALPAAIQPQTPQNLPEARHRGRLFDNTSASGAQTAPVWRTGITVTDASSIRAAGAGTTRRRYPPRRAPSPPGLATPGFRGLYGGLENTDDAALFDRASRLAGDRRPRDPSPGDDGPP
ncbi:hypothetical protein GGTG_04237 [Gaeumannomyces tritici R3-111a-1]|uniref:Uncharacterized protein n=1 Tax=Gaeumannomyces tritici (strain R3-111a-1) TaxID=644352 RepID=J3NSI6_GAET3|nr:hypothetical protein GGTG_04237 [Gaeumannomyces tritici R3-111a-1]EJT79149.1 hypothetical protein GGTG_04237 [Gaeumannomyces tritici R3-111a-1]